MDAESPHGLDDDELADLARLVDGTLPPDRLAEVEARVAASPRLAGLVARQRVAKDALRATADTGAPARLHARVERRGAARRAPRRRTVAGSVLALAAVLALALVVVLPGTLSGSPSVAEAAALAREQPDRPPPAPMPGVPQLLQARVDGVSFPDYAAKFGFEPVGARHDGISGRSATTVYYRKGGRAVAYTIVSGDALDPPSRARSTTLGGVVFRTFRDEGRAVVTWKRGGRTCVLSSGAVARSELVTLAGWRGKGAVRF